MKQTIKSKKYLYFGLAIIFGLAGAAAIFTSSAATRKYVSIELESATKLGNVTTNADSSASGGSALRFDAPPVAAPPDPVPPASPSGQAIPSGNLAGWNLIFADDFTVKSTTADGMNWKSLTDGSKIVYSGVNTANGGQTKWTTYPETYKDTYQRRAYRSGDVLSSHDGVLDFYLHDVAGAPAGANPSPQITGSSAYQTYGRYSARIKTDTTNLQGYYAAWLLWPLNESNWQCAESDFPETPLSATGSIGGFHHYGCSGSQDSFSGTANLTDWHTYTQEWGPGFRRYYIDNTLVKNSTNSVYSQPERWQLQTETNGTGTFGSGHLLVDWVAVYSYSP